MSTCDVPKFEIHDRVEKFTGDYMWEGVVCSVFWTPACDLRYVVAHPVKEGFVLHIYSEKNLRALK